MIGCRVSGNFLHSAINLDRRTKSKTFTVKPSCYFLKVVGKESRIKEEKRVDVHKCCSFSSLQCDSITRCDFLDFIFRILSQRIIPELFVQSGREEKSEKSPAAVILFTVSSLMLQFLPKT